MKDQESSNEEGKIFKESMKGKSVLTPSEDERDGSSESSNEVRKPCSIIDQNAENSSSKNEGDDTLKDDNLAASFLSSPDEKCNKSNISSSKSEAKDAPKDDIFTKSFPPLPEEKHNNSVASSSSSIADISAPTPSTCSTKEKTTNNLKDDEHSSINSIPSSSTIMDKVEAKNDEIEKSTQDPVKPKKNKKPKDKPITKTPSIPRSVGRRKAAEKSQMKWKDALEADKSFEVLSQMVVKPKHKRTKSKTPLLPKPLTTSTPINKNPKYAAKSLKKQSHFRTTTSTLLPKPPKEETFLQTHSTENSDFTIIDDELLRTMFQKQRCLSCFTQNMHLEIVKNQNGLTVEVIVLCTKCKEVPYKRGVSTQLPINFSSFYSCPPPNDVTCDATSLDFHNGQNDNKVELLVCDVDVLSENHLRPEVDISTTVHDNSSEGINVSADRRKQHGGRRRRRGGEGGSPKKRPQINPPRPCVFCSKMQVRLSRHIKMSHADQPFVQNLLKQPLQVQAKMIRQLRSEGIFAENQRRLEEGRGDLLMIRNQGSGELSSCNQCHGYYKKKLLWRHRLTCLGRPNESESASDSPPGDEPRAAKCAKHEETNTSRSANGANEGENSVEDDGIPAANEVLETGKMNNGIQDSSANTSATMQQKIATDISKIHQIKAIFEGISHHGIFSQPGACDLNGLLPSLNGTPDTVSRVNKPHPDGSRPSEGNKDVLVTGDGSSPKTPNGGQRDAMNEDQFLLDSLPAILDSGGTAAKGRSSSFSSFDDNSFNSFHHPWRPDENEDGGSCDNSFYTWQDISSGDVTQEDFADLESGNRAGRKRKARSEFQYQFWTKEEEKTIITYFTEHIKALKVPGKDICREFLVKYPDINTDWTRVKYKVYNQIQKQKKRMKRMKETTNE